MRPEEKQNNIVRTAFEIMKRSETEEGPEITFDQALKIVQVEQIWRIASIAHQIRIAIDDLTDEISEDVSGSLDQTNNRLSGIERTLFDTLGSEKTGAALDALTQLPEVIHS